MAAVERALEELVSSLVEERIAPLRAELERLRAFADTGPITIPEASRRLGVSVRCVQRWLRDGRLEAVPVGGVRLVRWPPPPASR